MDDQCWKETVIYSDEIQKLRNRRNSLEQHYQNLKKTSRDNIQDATPRRSGSSQKTYSFDTIKKIVRSKSTEPSSRQICLGNLDSAQKILVKAISQLLEKKKDMEDHDRFSYSTYSKAEVVDGYISGHGRRASLPNSKSESVDKYLSVSRGRAPISEIGTCTSNGRCRSLDRVDHDKMDEVSSTITGRSSNISIHKAITQLLEKKQRIEMSTKDLCRVTSIQSKAPSVLLAGFLRKAVPSRIGEWTTVYVQVQPGRLTLSDCYGRSKQKIILSSSMFKCRAVKVTDQVMKLLSKAGENVHELCFFETQSLGDQSRLFMTYSSVERDAWLAAMQDAIMEDESVVSDLSIEMEV